MNFYRTKVSEDAKVQLLQVVGRKARLMPTPELRSKLPFMHRSELSYLRNERQGYFGWERLLHIADVLGVSVEMKIEEAA